MKILYVTDANPNGTADLIVADGYDMIDSLDDAVFELLLTGDSNKWVTFGNDRCIYAWDAEQLPDNAGMRISVKTALSHVAVSPLSDGSETLEFLKKYFKVAS